MSDAFNGTSATWSGTPLACELLYEVVVAGNREVRIKLRGRQRLLYPEGTRGLLSIIWGGRESEQFTCKIAKSEDVGMLDCSNDTYLVFEIETTG
jgi:hypothetical protein